MKNLIFTLVAMVQIQAYAQVDQTEVYQYQEIKNNLLMQEEEKRKVLSELFKVTLGMKRISKKREHLVNEKDFVENRIKEATVAVANLKSGLGTQRIQMKARLRELYKFNGKQVLRLIFSSQSPIELDRNLKILKIVADHDYRLIRGYEKNVHVYALEKEKLRKHMSHMADIEKEIQAQERILVSQQEQKNKIIRSLDQSTLAHLVKLEKVRRDTKSDIAASFFEYRKKLSPPVEGMLTQTFGTIEDPIYGTKLRFKGNFFACKTHTPVRSVFAGEVVYSSEIPGFGQTIIVSHGDHYFSVYGNLSRANVKLGEKVNAHESIAESGGHYNAYGAGIYFEIRHFSEPVDPDLWLKGIESRSVSMVEGF